MRRALIAFVVVAAAVSLAACGGDKATTTSGPPAGAAALATMTVEAGAVTVKIEPLRLDASGAEFKVTFDTHSVELDLDVARNSTLTVGDTPWGGATWSGDGPGGHHREGTLRFNAAGPAQGSAVLNMAGLPGPVAARWSLGG